MLNCITGLVTQGRGPGAGGRGPDTARNVRISGRAVHLQRQAGTTSQILFEGSHEMLSREVVRRIDEDYRALGSASPSGGR